MREFFVQCFKDLHALTGLKQYIEIASQPDQGKAQLILDEIIMGMIRVSNSFNYIPHIKQQEIIRQRMIDDPDFYHLDARAVYRWLNAKSSFYFIQDAHKPIEVSREAITFDQLPETTKQMVNKFIGHLMDDKKGIKSVPHVTQAEIDSIRIEDLEERTGRESVSIHYKIDPEKVIEHEKKIEWMRLFHDTYTGKRMDNWISFEEYLMTDKKNMTQ